MKNATEYAKKLRGLLRRTKAADEPAARPDDPAQMLVYATLLWETTTKQADAAYVRLMKQVVDLNDLRVTEPRELADMFGSRYAMAEQRAETLCQVLNGLYLIEHGMSPEKLTEMPKRDARAALDAIEGMPPFISAYVVLHGLGGHAVPIDDQLLGKLQRDGIVDEEADITEVQAFLEHQIKAADADVAVAKLRTYAEAGGAGGRSTASKKVTRNKTTKSSSKKSAKNKSTKKKVTKKKTTRTRKKTTRKR